MHKNVTAAPFRLLVEHYLSQNNSFNEPARSERGNSDFCAKIPDALTQIRDQSFEFTTEINSRVIEEFLKS